MRSCIFAFACGVLFLQTRASLPTLWTAAALLPPLALLLALPVASKPARRIKLGAWLIFAYVAGFYWAAGLAGVRLAADLPRSLEGEDVRLVGVVASLPQTTDRGGRFQFDVERTITPGAIIPKHVSLSWYRDERTAGEALRFRAGERWQLTARLHRPHGTANPYGFDFELWALEQNIRATGYLRGDGENRRLNDFVVRPAYIVERARESIRDRFTAVLGDAPYRAVLVALAVGDQSGISQGEWKTFWRTGVGHLISISGLHITMVAALAAGLVGWGWRQTSWSLHWPARKAAALAGLTAALIYSLLAGFSIPTQRTLYMLAVAALALWLDRMSSASRVLALALLVVLLADPWAVLAPGFWLSFGAVAVILYVVAHRTTTDGWLAAAVRTQIAVSLGTLPLLLGLFQQVSLVSPLANAFAIPMVSFLIVPLTLLGAVLPFDWPLLAAHWLTMGSIALLEWFAAWPQATWESSAPPVWAVAFGLAGAAWLLAPRGLPARWLGALWLAPLFFLLPARPAPGAAWMTVLDVGQGLAVVVQTREHVLLYDTGPSWNSDADSGSRIVVPHLRGAGIRRLDALAVSHADNDHSGGALSVLGAIPTDWLLSSLPLDSAIVDHAERHLRCAAGQRWEWDGVTFEVLHPSPESYAEPDRKSNDRSCVIKVISAYGSILLTADIEALSEAELLARTPQQLRADVMLAPHHGSRTSSTPAFVAAVHPELALFTTGYRNRYGHPRAEIVARYAALPSRNLRSDEAGAIKVTLDKDGITTTAWRETGRRYWYGN